MDFMISWLFELDFITGFIDFIDFACFCCIILNRIDETMTMPSFPKHTATSDKTEHQFMLRSQNLFSRICIFSQLTLQDVGYDTGKRSVHIDVSTVR